MRLRNIPGSDERLAASEAVIQNERFPILKGNWSDLFHNDHPLCLEIGMGKGRFITDMALANPDINYIGIEKYSSVLIRALEKREALLAQGTETKNLFFIRMNAEDITTAFAPGEVSVIYLNFSDPWPKDRHAQRRLPGSTFLGRYQQILAEGGRVEFKTDNDDLFTFALDSARESGWTIQASTWDLHHDEQLNQGNIMTEYEERFSAKGNAIHKMIITPPSH